MKFKKILLPLLLSLLIIIVYWNLFRFEPLFNVFTGKYYFEPNVVLGFAAIYILVKLLCTLAYSSIRRLDVRKVTLAMFVTGLITIGFYVLLEEQPMTSFFILIATIVVIDVLIQRFYLKLSYVDALLVSVIGNITSGLFIYYFIGWYSEYLLNTWYMYDDALIDDIGV